MSWVPVVPPPPPHQGGGGSDGDAPPPLWDVGWTVERPIGFTAEGPHPCGDPPPVGVGVEVHMA